MRLSELDTVKGVVLVASFVRTPRRVPRWLLRLFGPLLFRIRPPAFALRAMLLGIGATPAMVAAVQRAICSVEPQVLLHRLQAVLEVDFRPLLARGHTPLLYLQASRDRLVPKRVGAEIVQARSDIQLQRIEGPHLLLQCAPQQAAAVISRFVESLAP